MANNQPMLGDVELQLVQKIETDEDTVLTQHSVPALEGDFLQRQKRWATQITLNGILTGLEAGEGLKTLRDKFRAAEPVPFVADIATAVRIDEMLIEEMGVRELAGKPERFEYAFTLREYTPAEEVTTEDPPPDPDPPKPPEDDIDQNVGTLIVEIIVEDQASFDFSQVGVTVQGTTQDGLAFSRTLTNREENIWTEENVPASQGDYSVTAVVTVSPTMVGSAATAVQAGQKASSTITLRPGVIIAKAYAVHFRFDNSLIEPCMRPVLKEVARRANDPKRSDEKLLIVGHTDKTGSEKYNQSLSERRARSAFAYLRFGNNNAVAVAEWNQLRQRRTPGQLPSNHDTWDVYQYQYMLQDLELYRGNIDGIHGDLTDYAIDAFRCTTGLPSGVTMDDPTWEALIRAFLKKGNLQIPDGKFLPNADNGCQGGLLEWLGCGEESPTTKWGSPPKATAWRPYRRTEFLFVKATKLPCAVPKPDTLDLPPPPPSQPARNWCVGSTQPGAPHCCFITYKSPQPEKEDKIWLIESAKSKKIIVQGKIQFENFLPSGTKIAFKYVLITPEGEFVEGEYTSGNRRGEGKEKSVTGVSNAQGTFEHIFSHADKPTGVYTLEIKGAFLARLAGEPPQEATGNIVCKQLNGNDPKFEVVVIVRPPLIVNPTITLASPFVVVKQPNTNPARQKITLELDYPFCHGDGTFTRSNNNIRFFNAAVGGTEITFDGTDNVFLGAQLTQGIELFAEGFRASTSMDDVLLTLSMTSATTSPRPPVSPAATTTMTAVAITVDAIKFNHDPSSAATNALSIRKNRTQFITVPEWQDSVSVNAADSLAAYAIRETRGNTITIQTKFQIQPGPHTAELRAVASPAHILGKVAARQLSFLPTGNTNFEVFNLQDVQIWNNTVGVGVHDIAWQWQVRFASTGPWIDFTQSKHRIYTLLEIPKAPWQQSPFAASNTQLPWSEVLDFACDWAARQINRDGAAAAITRAVYDLGSPANNIFDYDCPNGGSTHYAAPNFNCTAFLERLRGNPGNGRYVNCTDCATFVSTFANVLGCDLWQSRMGNSFALNPILAIGSTTWETACGWPGFSYHEVAWKGACTANEEVFDACLKVDGDANPTAPPHTPLFPTNIRFGNTGDGQYRDRLAANTANGRPNCNPQPGTRIRRTIS